MADMIREGDHAATGNRGATIDATGAYRYHLWRTVSSAGRTVTFII